jgi:hypothetical protein
MSERRQMVKKMAHWLIIAVFVGFVIPTALGFYLINKKQQKLHEQFHAAPAGHTTRDSTAAAAAPVAPVFDSMRGVPAVKDTVHGQ